MKSPCKHCPYRSDVKPFLTMERGEELAYLPLNPYNDFSCHKTTEPDEEDTGEMLVTEKSLTCAGFLTVRAQVGKSVPEGFEPAWEICYIDEYDMIQAYDEAKRNGEL